jgi:hypothetical protein
MFYYRYAYESGTGQGSWDGFIWSWIRKGMSMAWKRYPSVFDKVTAYVSILAQRA